MDLEGPPPKKRKTKETNPSPKKLKVKKFAKDSLFNETLENKLECAADAQTIPEVFYRNRLTARSIEEDDEVYIFQCPLDVDPSSLIGKRLSFSKTSVVTDSSSAKSYDIETVVSPKKMQCILLKDTGPGFELCNLNVSGMIILSDATVPLVNLVDYVEENVEDCLHPPNLKPRNPHLTPEEIKQLRHKDSKRKSKKVS